MLHYQGQSFELEVVVPSGTLDGAAIEALDEAYGVEHERTYGHRAGADEPVELVTLKVVGRGKPTTPRATLSTGARQSANIGMANRQRPAYFGPRHGWLDTCVVNRADLVTPQAGPCIVEEYDSTCVVPPGWTGRLDRFRNIVLTGDQLLGAGTNR